jgi:hypothetical protein
MTPTVTKEPNEPFDLGDNGFDLLLPELGDAESEMALGDAEFVAELSVPGAEWTEEEGAQEAIETLDGGDDVPGSLEDDPFDAPEERALLAAEAAAEDAAVADAFAGDESNEQGFQDRDGVQDRLGRDRPTEAEAAGAIVHLDDGGGDGPQNETWLVEEPPAMLDDDGDDEEGAAEPPPQLAIPA